MRLFIVSRHTLLNLKAILNFWIKIKYKFLHCFSYILFFWCLFHELPKFPSRTARVLSCTPCRGPGCTQQGWRFCAAAAHPSSHTHSSPRSSTQAVLLSQHQLSTLLPAIPTWCPGRTAPLWMHSAPRAHPRGAEPTRRPSAVHPCPPLSSAAPLWSAVMRFQLCSHSAPLTPSRVGMGARCAGSPWIPRLSTAPLKAGA